MKPRIKLDPTKPGWRKWWCFSYHTPYFGGVHIKEGKGYSPKEAYEKWKRCYPLITETWNKER